MPNLKAILLSLVALVVLGAIALCQAVPLTPREQSGRWGYVNENGVYVIPPKYFAAKPFSDGLALVVTSKPLQPLGSEYGEFRLAKVTWIDSSGREIRRPISVRSAHGFSEGLAAVTPDAAMRLGGGCAKSGYIDRNGTWAIPPRFDEVRDFSEGLAPVNIGAQCGMGGRWGYIDRQGTTVIPPRLLLAGQFHNGRACVMEGTKQTVIDRSGNTIVEEKCK